MRVIIPEDFDDIPFIMEDLNKSYYHSKVILSPFMYMNYEDAVKKTCEIFTRCNANLSNIIDCTGMTIDVYKWLSNKYEDDDFSLLYFNKKFRMFVVLTYKETNYILQSKKDIPKLFKHELYCILNKDVIGDNIRQEIEEGGWEILHEGILNIYCLKPGTGFLKVFLR